MDCAFRKRDRRLERIRRTEAVGRGDKSSLDILAKMKETAKVLQQTLKIYPSDLKRFERSRGVECLYPLVYLNETRCCIIFHSNELKSNNLI